MIKDSAFIILQAVKTYLYRKMPDIFHILVAFCMKMLRGYYCYAWLQRKSNGRFLYVQFYKGSGDTAIAAAWIQYCQQNGIEKQRLQNCEFVVNGSGAGCVARLFLPKEIPVTVLRETQSRALVCLQRFLGRQVLNMQFLHYMSDVPMYTNSIIFLSGLHGIDFLDLYRAAVFGGREFILPTPKWDEADVWANTLFHSYSLIPRHTVLIAPEAASIAAGPKQRFWSWIAYLLKKKGFSVCTNIVRANDIPIPGTTGVMISYEKLDSFLRLGGYFIGYRSGLCDLIAFTACKKIVIYPKQNWPVYGGMLIDSTKNIFSLRKMGLCYDVLELEYEETTAWKLAEQIVEHIEMWEIQKDEGTDTCSK